MERFRRHRLLDYIFLFVISRYIRLVNVYCTIVSIVNIIKMSTYCR